MSQQQPEYVLIVDDNPDMRRLLERMAGAAGYAVRTAPDGETALKLAFAAPPMAVLLDVAMPGVNGLEVCRRLRADPRTATIPILLVTANADLTTRLQAFQAGADDFLAKPFDPQELAVRLRSHLELADSRRRLAQLEGVFATIRLISHEFNNPLQSVVGGLDLLAMARSADGPRISETEALAMIAEGTDRLRSLAVRLLAVTEPAFKESPIGDMLDIEAACCAGQVTFRGDCPPEPQPPPHPERPRER
jgi:DNA-binding response OmpR family regulator